jgi:hypothetical protein
MFTAAVAIPLASRAAGADTPNPAETLFRQGRTSADAGDYPRACTAFADSLRLDPAPGTLFNLADCEEHVGRLASAWGHFLRVESILPATDERRELAHERAATLAPRLPWMTLALAPDCPRDARVFRDDVEMDGARLAVPLPVDPGPHSVLVVASWHESRSVTVVAVEHETVAVVAFPGAAFPRPPGRPAPIPALLSRRPAWILGAAGVASLGVGTYFGARALAERNVSDGACAAGTCANTTALGAYESSRSDARASDVALGIGVVALAVSGYLLLAPGSDARAVGTPLRLTGGGVGSAW